MRSECGIDEHVHAGVQVPLGVRTALSQVIESQIAGGMRNQLFGRKGMPFFTIRSSDGGRRGDRGRRRRQHTAGGRWHSGPFLFSFLQSFVNATHGFLSRVEAEGTMLASRRRPSNSSRFWSKACVSRVWPFPLVV